MKILQTASGRAAILSFVIGCVLALISFCGLGINDTEWRHIVETGLPSSPEKLTWSAWQQNFGDVQWFRTEHTPQGSQPEEYRVGRGHGAFFDFTAYQGRFHVGAETKELPAIGPGWGASYDWKWAGLAFCFSGCFLIARYLVVKKAAASEESARVERV